MSGANETFFTVVGCMDGRVQKAISEFGRTKFGAEYPDTITEAGIAGIIANNPDPKFVENLKTKLLVSIEKHHSKGIVVDGHQECAGNPVDDERHKEDIRRSIEFIRNLIENKIPIIGVFVVRNDESWQAEEV
ncbi:MAG: hypothetical protein A3C30_01410 [Candidatus Levybacteria bacterium RIFCSPHIGHO2_02_FULL_40_18]|nr:MAG: hypothetical protein A2869_00975 [Candidatus Levybacteria bacterium RIFCSPHIGHO2_01_FULL_40_58]OGH26654.1 MAG: hypothetical protein A3C30_01410 [Candidatus Levybacteria bacterium RIFCSPHIGHO2_02_FULL_40_18]OGH31183.1 MAG: hypothetical protein A3E43_00245 [Candidatus Levybacteria bacterium RIFCSPHIGHO2_12_FULL_40_31]OGH39865.1 MAG: hypothetical protein A2894_03750 [Candidatus Levybacteria bacterium RIFCSPLOWO2_01_FULL_40_64]OGH48889.1 MAG: hypothetical protein A3I54_04855 [Candidatus Lev